jgi:hypothetical protein
MPPLNQVQLPHRQREKQQLALILRLMRQGLHTPGQHLEQDEVLDAMNMLLVANHLQDEHPLILHQLQVMPA